MTINTQELRDRAAELEQIGTCEACDAAYLRKAADEINRLAAQRDWYKLALSMIANDDDNAKTVSHNALNYSPGGNNV